LLGRRLLFVTGKGGVGKTAVAAALGLCAARAGRNVLVCAQDGRPDLGVAFGAGALGFEPVRVPLDERDAVAGGGLALMTMRTEESLREYVRIHLKIPLVTRLGPLARTLDFVADAAPGVKEILSVGKLAWEVREDHYDLVVVDAPACGDVVGYLDAPAAVEELVHVGMIRHQTEWIREVLVDPACSGVVVVSTPEEMPTTETLELLGALAARPSVPAAAVVANRVLPELFTRAERELFEGVRADAGSWDRLVAATGPGLDAAWRGAELAVALRRRASAHLARLRAGVGDLPVLYAPELDGGDTGLRRTDALATALGDELG